MSSINSKSPISPIFCVNVLESVQNISFLCKMFGKPLDFTIEFLFNPLFGGSGFAGPLVTKQILKVMLPRAIAGYMDVIDLWEEKAAAEEREEEERRKEREAGATNAQGGEATAQN